MNAIHQKQDFTNIADSEIHSFNKYDIFRRKDGIIQLQFYSGYLGELKEATIIIDTIKILKDNDQCLVLIISADDATFSKEARALIASEEVSKMVKADAFVINSLALKILMNGYLKFNKPNRPTHFFNTAQTAIDWLKGLK